jgi:hypothetical protein
VDIGLKQDQLRFRRRQHGLRQTLRCARQFDLARRIVQDVMMPRHPPEPHAQGHDAVMLTTEAERLAIRFAVVEDVALIALQNCAGDFHRLGDAALIGPVEEETDVHAATLDGVLGVAF